MAVPAQGEGIAAANNDLSRDFLLYSYHPSMEGKPRSILSSVPAKVYLPSKPKRKSKEYRIAEDGSFEYCYREDSLWKFRPMAARTFYLETTRQGIISPEITYPEFLKMTTVQKQALLNEKQNHNAPSIASQQGKYLDATVKYAVTSEGMKMLVSNGSWKVELKPYDDADKANSNILFLQLQASNIVVPRVIENLLSPKDKAGISSKEEFDELLDIMRQAGEKTNN